MEYEFQVGDLVECAKPGGIDIRITTGMRGTVQISSVLLGINI